MTDPAPHAEFRRQVAALSDDLDTLRVAMKSLMHDLEATRRERDAAIAEASLRRRQAERMRDTIQPLTRSIGRLKRMLRERGIDPDSRESS